MAGGLQVFSSLLWLCWRGGGLFLCVSCLPCLLCVLCLYKSVMYSHGYGHYALHLARAMGLGAGAALAATFLCFIGWGMVVGVGVGVVYSNGIVYSIIQYLLV